MQLIQPAQQAIWQNNLPALPGNSWGTTVTASATPHVKGSYSTLIASTTYETFGFWLAVAGSSSSGARTDRLLDIAIGAAASEVVIVPNLLSGWRPAATVGGGVAFFIPLFIPKGTRISARLQSLVGSGVAQVQIHLREGMSGLVGPIFSGCDVYGIDTSTSQGTSHTPGSTGAFSTAANVGSTTSRPYGAVMLAQGGVFSGTTMNDAGYQWELQTNGVTRCAWGAYTSSAEVISGPYPPTPFSTRIPLGAQLQVRGFAGSALNQAQDVAFYCFY